MTTQETYKKFDNLLNAICKNSDDVDYDLEFVQESITKLPEYFNTVVTSELSIKMAYARYEDDIDALHNRIENIDSMRRSKHIALTDSINQLNRLCDGYQVPRIFDTGRGKDLNSNLQEDREIAVNMCYNFCKDVFLDAKAKELLREQGNVDVELYKISSEQLGSFHPEIMKNVDMSEAKTGSTLESLIKRAEAMAKPAVKQNQGVQEYGVR